MALAPAESSRRPGPGAWPKPSLRSLLEDSGRFLTSVELVTSRGLITERSGRRGLELARLLSEDPRIDALSITDNPGGNAMLSADTLGTDLISRGQEVIIHLSCKDWNRNALESRGWKLASEGFQNVLALSGDYPNSGFRGQAQAVFDIDSAGLLRMFSDMNAGRPASPGQPSRERTNFLLGAVVNNYKRHENEVMPQYFKLGKKIENGAQFIINQIGYDSRKQHELLEYMRLRGWSVPVVANVYVLSLQAARFFHAGRIPGCVVTDELLAVIEKQAASPDRGRAFFLEFAAKQVAIARGLGFRGAYLGGHLKYEDYNRILDLAAGFSTGDWKLFAKEIGFHQPDEFYYFEPDPGTGLSSTEVNRRYAASKTPEALAQARREAPFSYKLNRALHDQIFDPDGAGFRAARGLVQIAEKRGWSQALHRAEHAVKVLAFDCRDCGDCSLPEIAYLCPESQCAKNQRNGPCGGTRDGLCEVGEKQCIWAKAYDRLKPYGEEEAMLAGPVVFKNGALKGTSAWANALLGRDHRAE